MSKPVGWYSFKGIFSIINISDDDPKKTSIIKKLSAYSTGADKKTKNEKCAISKIFSSLFSGENFPECMGFENISYNPYSCIIRRKLDSGRIQGKDFLKEISSNIKKKPKDTIEQIKNNMTAFFKELNVEPITADHTVFSKFLKPENFEYSCSSAIVDFIKDNPDPTEALVWLIIISLFPKPADITTRERYNIVKPELDYFEMNILPYIGQESLKNDSDAEKNTMTSFVDSLLDSSKKTEYVMPYISDSIRSIAATSTTGLKMFSQQELIQNNIDTLVYEAFLSQKIARTNSPEECRNSFQVIHYTADSWRIFLNDKNEVVAYWAFVALTNKAYKKYSSGQYDAKNIQLNDIEYIGIPGIYNGFLLISGTIVELRSYDIVNSLYSSWLSWIENLAVSGIFFSEISSMVSSPGGISSLSQIGMKQYGDYNFGGKMFRYDFSEINNIEFLKNNYPVLTEKYINLKNNT